MIQQLTQLVLTALVFAAAPATASTPNASAAIDAVYRALDLDRDRAISIPQVLDALGLRADIVSPRIMQILSLFDGDSDGQITRAEFVKGHEKFARQQTARVMGTDGDGNQKLSLKEYALGMPDPKGHKLKSGYTERQVAGFNAFDVDKDGFVTAAEVENHIVADMVDHYDGITLGHRLFALDADGNRALSVAELQRLYGAKAPSLAQAAKLLTKLGGKAGTLTRQRAIAGFERLSTTERDELKLRLDRREVSQQIAAAVQQLYAVSDVDGDAELTLAELASMYGQDALKEGQLQLILSFDANKDRRLNRAEILEGLRKFADARMVTRSMALDVNADGKLTMQEYALGFPDPKSPKNDDGYTKAQIAGFAANDVNGDDKVTRLELEVVASRNITMILRSTATAAAAFRFDANKDRVLNREEFKAAFAGWVKRQPATDLDGRYASWSSSIDKADALTWTELERALQRLMRDEPRAFDIVVALAK